MDSIRRLHQTLLLVCYLLFPNTTGSEKTRKNNDKDLPHYITDYIEIPVKKIPLFLNDPAQASGPNGTMGFLVPQVFSLAAPFILFRLKRSGFSGCRVTVRERGLMVEATR